MAIVLGRERGARVAQEQDAVHAVLDQMTCLRSVKALAGVPALRRMMVDGKTVIRR